MDLAIFFSGDVGKRFVLNLISPNICPQIGACGIDKCVRCKDYDFTSNVVMVHEFNDPSSYGVYIEDVNSILPELVSADVMIAINLHPDILIELPEILADNGYKALVIPIEDGKWCSVGLRKQIENKSGELDIESAFPKPFCTLNPSSKFLSRFCSYFRLKMPEFEVEMDENVIGKVKVKSDVCGCAYYVARRMEGYVIESKEEFWKEIYQHQCAYPCMASMDRDAELVESPFHLAGYVMVYSFSKAVGIDATNFVPKYFRKFLR